MGGVVATGAAWAGIGGGGDGGGGAISTAVGGTGSGLTSEEARGWSLGLVHVSLCFVGEVVFLIATLGASGHDRALVGLGGILFPVAELDDISPCAAAILRDGR